MVAENKRRHVRAPLLAKIIMVGGDAPQVRFARNLSLSGIFIESINPLPVNTKVSLLFPLHHPEKTVNIKAKVVRTVLPATDNDGTIPGMGMEFTDVSFDSSVLIDDYIVKIKNIYEELAILFDVINPDIKRLSYLIKKSGIQKYSDMMELREIVKKECLALGIVVFK
jgi:hypothetical protein